MTLITESTLALPGNLPMAADDFDALLARDHWLGWLGDSPEQLIRNQVEGMLRKQVPTSDLHWIRLVGTPKFLTGGRSLPFEPDNLVITRAGFAVAFELEVGSEKGIFRHSGTLSWVASNLDTIRPRRDRIFLDMDMAIEQAEQELKLRIYEIDLEPEEDTPPGGGDPKSVEPAPRREIAATSPEPAPYTPWWKFWRR